MNKSTAARQLTTVAAAKAAVCARIIGYGKGADTGDGYSARAAQREFSHAVQAHELHLVTVV